LKRINRPGGAAAALLLALILAGCTSERPSVVYETGSSSVSARAESHTGAPAMEHFSSEGETALPVSRGADPASQDVPGPPAEESVCVHVCGEVRTPGVYELPAGSRVWQALEAAGGITEYADDRALNQAALLSDGCQVYVWSQAETSALRDSGQLPFSAGGDGPAAEAAAERVNLNTADREKLMTLPGIGEARAEAILQYREQNGGFSAPEELMNIDGIGEKSFQKLRELITV